ncbi:hypothetical protein F8388_002709 [Cannabis sativa]|uniref:Uncharacterized protein n=1 Tax=Cannabis sativa TaxID=3483 RepID=A0A7J6DRN1_CANSA|nr:hypothetical protein F8388_002709 [Cannabis sativa]
MIKVVLVVLAELVLISILTFLTLTLTHSHMRRSTIVGTICILFNIMIYVAPLAVMKLIITTKSVEATFIQIWKRKSMDQYLVVPYLATLINCLVWTLYGLPFIYPGSISVVTINGSGLKFVITTKSVEKSMEQYSAVPYLATLINCLVWTLYGLLFIHPGSILVVTINGYYLVIEVTYLIIFLIF